MTLLATKLEKFHENYRNVLFRTKQQSNLLCYVLGEGMFAGEPAVFVRLTGCNLRCQHCDTKYSWLHGKEKSVEDIMEEVNEFPEAISHIVITGGEPLLQQPELQKLISKLDKEDFTIEIETNGTIKPLLKSENLFYAVSPKIEKSNENIVDFVALAKEKNNTMFKFVVNDDDDVKYFMKTVINPFNIREFSMFMPQCTTEEEFKVKSKWLIERCKVNGIRFCPRIQVMIYGNRKGI